jgi:hypothetical protein
MYVLSNGNMIGKQWEHDRKTLGTREKCENMSLGQKKKLDASYLCMLGLLVIP